MTRRPEFTVASCLRACLRHNVHVLLLLAFIVITIHATPHFLDHGTNADHAQEIQLPAKRPARLSYFRAPYNRGRSRFRSSYGSHRSYGYGRRSFGSYNRRRNEWWRKKAVNRYMMPWDNLPNTNCLRKYCQGNGDCCRRFSKCNKRAHVCYDCWYGHPCRTSYDCCAQFPYCNTVLNTCTK